MKDSSKAKHKVEVVIEVDLILPGEDRTEISFLMQPGTRLKGEF